IPALVDPGAKIGNYTVTSTNGTLTITQAQPLMNWPRPVNIFAGMPLSSLQLNAQAKDPSSSLPIPGQYSYTPTSGTLLEPGADQMLQVVFTPQDSLNYMTASQTSALTVDPAVSVSITSPLGALGQSGAPFSYTIAADGSAPMNFNAAG